MRVSELPAAAGVVRTAIYGLEDWKLRSSRPRAFYGKRGLAVPPHRRNCFSAFPLSLFPPPRPFPIPIPFCP